MRTGVVEKILEHRAKVNDFAITPSGSHLIASLETRKKNGCAQVWHIKDTASVYEFSDLPGYCLSLRGEERLIFISKDSILLHAPYSIHTFQCNGVRPRNYTHVIPVEQVFEKPVVTDDDKYIVMVARTENGSTDTAPSIFVFSVTGEGPSRKCYSPDVFPQNVPLDASIQVKNAPHSPCHLIILVSSKHNLDGPLQNGLSEDGVRRRFMFILDLQSGNIHTCSKLDAIPTIANHRPIYNFLHVLYTQTEDSDLPVEKRSGVPYLKLACFLHEASIAIYKSGSFLYACRTDSAEEIAKLDVHQNICHVSACPDDQTLVVGCDDGSIFSYVFIDAARGDHLHVLANIPSRQVELPSAQKTTAYKPEDVQQKQFSRPSTATSGTSDKDLLEEIVPVDKIRPKSDTFLYLNNKSTSCSVM